jgi:hypothetical protein
MTRAAAVFSGASMKFLGLGMLVELDYEAAANARLT